MNAQEKIACLGAGVLPRLTAGLLKASHAVDPLLKPVSRLYEIREVLPGTADCAVGLAAGLRFDGAPSSITEAVARRCGSLYLSGVSPIIVFSGGFEVAGRKEADTMAGIALGMGVPQEKIMLDLQSMRTHHHPPNVEPILAAAGAGTILVVCHTLQTRRARAIFKKHYGKRLVMYFARVAGAYELAPQKRFASLTSCLFWNVSTHILAKFKGWA